jgi:hypothetical protein
MDAHIALFIERNQAIGIFLAVLGLQLITAFFSEVRSDGFVIDALEVERDAHPKGCRATPKTIETGFHSMYFIKKMERMKELT